MQCPSWYALQMNTLHLALTTYSLTGKGSPTLDKGNMVQPTRGVLVHNEQVPPQPRYDEPQVELPHHLHASKVSLGKHALQLAL